MNYPNPWQILTEENVIGAVESRTGERLTNLCLQRNSYINRVFELELEESRERLIVKFYRPDRWSKAMIASEHDFLNTLFQRDIPVIPPQAIHAETIFDYEGILFAVFPKKGGRALDEFDEELWQQIGRLLGRIHLVSQDLTITNRILWRPAAATTQNLETIIKAKCLPPDYEQPFIKLVQEFINKFDGQFNQTEFIVLHGDCHRGNFIIRPGEGIYLADFDDMSSGPAIQDIWMLFPDLIKNCPRELDWFCEGYETFRPFPDDTMCLLPALRGMRVIHFIAWSAMQHHEPYFQQFWLDWGSPRYWNEVMRELQSIIYD